MSKAPHYTKEDMKTLWKMSEEGSPVKEYMGECKYDPKLFQKFLFSYHLKKDIYYLFEAPLEEVPLLINKGEISGYLRFRLSIGK